MSALDTGRSRLRLAGDPPGGPRACAIWGLGVLVYFIAVVHRSSLGVAGIDAAARFHISASELSTFSILQVLVYAGMQIPVGMLVDRFGTKRMLIVGVVLLTTGQLGFALSHSYATALGSRAVLGCGDAMTFISVLRLGSRWFPARRGPLIAQGAALFGMAGNLVSTIALARLLHSAGWTPTFVGTALGGALVLVLIVLFMKDHPEGYGQPLVHQHPSEEALRAAPFDLPAGGSRQRGAVRRQLVDAWGEPGTRLGLWVHFTTQFSAMVFLLLWGMPFLVEGQGLSRGTAGSLLTLVVLSNMVLGMVFGQIIARHHGARLPLALGTVAVTAAGWVAVLAWPSAHAPLWLLITLCAVLGASGPASMIGFDFARPANPPERFGTASGIVNMGGFTASIIVLLAVGVLLDATGDNFTVALSSVFVVQALGVSQILRLRGQAARRERETITVSRVEAVHTAEARA